MPNDAIESARKNLSASNISAEDLAWFDKHQWNDASIPLITEAAQVPAYQRREAALNAATGGLSFAERAASLEGKLAATIGAKLADWKERGEDEDD